MAVCRWVGKPKECKLLSKIEKRINNLAKKTKQEGLLCPSEGSKRLSGPKRHVGYLDSGRK